MTPRDLELAAVAFIRARCAGDEITTRDIWARTAEAGATADLTYWIVQAASAAFNQVARMQRREVADVLTSYEMRIMTARASETA